MPVYLPISRNRSSTPSSSKLTYLHSVSALGDALILVASCAASWTEQNESRGLYMKQCVHTVMASHAQSSHKLGKLAHSRHCSIDSSPSSLSHRHNTFDHALVNVYGPRARSSQLQILLRVNYQLSYLFVRRAPSLPSLTLDFHLRYRVPADHTTTSAFQVQERRMRSVRFTLPALGENSLRGIYAVDHRVSAQNGPVL